MTLGSQVWMSHGDTIVDLGEGYKTICSTGDVNFAGFRAEGEQVWGIQFHLKYSTAQRVLSYKELHYEYLRMFWRVDA